MKRTITLLITIMMLVSSFMTSFVPVYAEEDDTVLNDENVAITETVSEEETEKQDEETIVVVEEPAEDETVPNNEEETTVEVTEDETSVAEETAIEVVEEETGEIEEPVTEYVDEENIDEQEETSESAPKDSEELVPMEDEIFVEADAEIDAANPNPNNFKFYVVDRKPGTFLTLGKFFNDYKDPWLKAFRVNKDSYIDIIYGDGENDHVIYKAGGLVASELHYLDTFFYYTHVYGIQLDTRKLIDDKVPSGGILKAVFHVVGYNDLTLSIDTKALEMTLCKEVPADANAQFDSNGNLVITSSDKNWLKGLAAYENSYKNPGTQRYDEFATNAPLDRTSIIGGGYVEVDGVKLQNTATVTDLNNLSKRKNANTVYTYENDKITISRDTLVANGIDPSGRHGITLSAEGYLVYSVEQTVPFNADDLTVSVDNNGKIIIECTNEEVKNEYISNLTSVNDKRLTYVGVSGKDGKVFGSAIEEENGKAIISASDFKAAMNNTASGKVNLVIKAKGYDAVTKEATLPYLVADGLKDDGSLLIFEVPKKYYVNTDQDVTLKVLKGGNEVTSEVVENEKTGKNTFTITAHEVGSYELVATIGSATDKLAVVVSANGLSVKADVAKAESFVGAENVKMKATAEINTSEMHQDVTSSLSYDSDKKDIATIDEEGNLTFLSAGTVTITASIGDLKASTVYTVYNYDPSIASLDLTLKNVMFEEEYDPNLGMEVGETFYFITKVGDKEVTDKSIITVTPSAKSVTGVVSGNAIKALKTGKSTVTVTVNDLGKKKTGKMNVTVINKVFTQFAVDETTGLTADDKAYETISYGEAESYQTLDTITVDASSHKTIALSTKALDKRDAWYEDVPTVKYKSADTGVATVDANGVVTIKKEGQTTITASLTGNPTPLNREIKLRIVDLTPKLSTNKITINKYQTSGEMVYVSAAYQDYHKAREVDSVEITGPYDLEFTPQTGLDPDAIRIYIPDDKVDLAKSGKQTLTINMKDGGKCVFDFTVNVTAKLPSISVKTSGSYNSFLNEGNLSMTYSAKDIDPEDITPTFVGGWASFDEDENVVLKNGSKSGIVSFKVNGYNKAVEKKVSFSVKTTKPTVKLETSTLTIMKDAAATSKELTVRLIDGKKKGIEGGMLTVNGLGLNNKAVEVDEDGYASFTITDLNGGAMTLAYKGEDKWSSTINLKLTVKTNDKLPSAKLGTSTLILNKAYKQTGNVKIDSSTKTEKITNVKFEPKEDVLTYSFDAAKGAIVVSMKNDTANGTYSVVVTPEIKDGTVLKPVTLKVKVQDGDPKLTLKPTTVNLNRNYVEIIEVTPSFSAKAPFDELELTGVKAVAQNVDVAKITYNAETDKFEVSLKSGAADGKYVYQLYPIFGSITSNTAAKLTVSVNSKAASFKTSFKDKLNPLAEETSTSSSVTLSNVKGIVEGASSSSADFAVAYDEETEKLVVTLKNRNMEDKTYTVPVKVQLVDNGNEKTVNGNIKVTVKRTAPKVTVVNKTLNIFDTTNNGEIVTTAFLRTSGVDGTIAKVEAEIVKDTGGYEIIPSAMDGKTGAVSVKIKDGSKIKARSSTKVKVTVYWNGDFNNKKKTSLTLTLKDITGTIKTR